MTISKVVFKMGYWIITKADGWQELISPEGRRIYEILVINGKKVFLNSEKALWEDEIEDITLYPTGIRQLMIGLKN